jgi:hypothetical protein
MAFSPIYAIKDRHGRSTLLPYKQGVDDGSTLTLDFTKGVLDPRLTHSRLGNGTFINSQGLVQWAAANMMTRSQSQDVNGYWNAFSTTVTRTASQTDPFGGSGAVKLDYNATSADAVISRSVSVQQGLQYTISVWLRADSGTLNNVRFGRAAAATGAYFPSLTTTWQRFSLTFTATGASDGIELRVLTSGTPKTASFHVFGAQLEPGGSMGDYNPALLDVSYHAARFDYDPTTFAPRGLLFEGEGENRALNSETFPTTGTGQWGPTGVNQNATKITSPDGTANAIQFNETTNNELHRINQGITGSAGPYTISIWAKALDTGSPRRLFLNAVGFMNASALFDLDPAVQTGASGSAVAVAGTAANRAGTWIKYPNGWYRCILVGQYNTNSSLFLQINRASSTTASDDTYAGSATNGLALWGVQVEKGVGASSYIPTGVSQGARVAESCVMNDITALNYSAQRGTIYWNGRFNRQPYDSYVTVVGFMTAIDQPAFETFSNAANYFVAARGSNLTTSGANETSRPYTLNTAIKYAATANTVTDPVVRGNLNGSASVANKTGTGDMHVATRFVIGRQPVGTYGVNYPSLTLAQIKYWPFAKSAAELIGLTAP